MKSLDIPQFKFPPKTIRDLPFRLEKLEAKVGYNPRAPHRHSYYELFFFEVGGGMHMVDFEELGITRGHVHTVAPGQIHYMHRAPQARGWVLKFSPEFFLYSDRENLGIYPFLKQQSPKALTQIPPREWTALLQLIAHIQEEYMHRENDFQHMILHYLSLILLKCHRLYNAANSFNPSLENSLFNGFQNLLEEHYIEQNRVSFYCEKLGVSDDKLNLVVKSVSGSCPSELISARLLLEAKRWLLHSDKSNKEIAYLLNFQDHAYFNRWFKRHETQTPGAFRTAYREKYHT